MKKRRVVLAVVLAAAAAGYGLWTYLSQDRNQDGLSANGHIEVTEVDLSFRLSGHVARLLVEEGDHLTSGQAVAELDRTVLLLRRDQAGSKVKELQAACESMEVAIRTREEILTGDVARAKAQNEAAQARYDSLRRGSREQEIREAAAAVDRARAEWVNQYKELARIKKLFEQGAVPTSQLDQALAGARAAKAVFQEASERQALVLAGPRKEAVAESKANWESSSAALDTVRASQREVEKMRHDLKALEAQLAQARTALKMAEQDLVESSIESPFDGFVTVKAIEQGEFVQPGTPVVTVARLSEVWVKCYVSETELGKVALGQPARVTTDTFPEKVYPGRVTFISPEAEFTPKNVQTKEERVKLVYRVKVTLANPNQELKAGMPVDVILDVDTTGSEKSSSGVHLSSPKHG